MLEHDGADMLLPVSLGFEMCGQRTRGGGTAIGNVDTAARYCVNKTEMLLRALSPFLRSYDLGKRCFHRREHIGLPNANTGTLQVKSGA